MNKPSETAIVRIYNAGGSVVGTGFLINERHILTCAHVVAYALDIPEDTAEPPEATLELDFPLLAAGQMLAARVCHWQPDVDVAGLQLLGWAPPDAEPVRLVTTEDDLWGHPFRAFGFPLGRARGVWVSGVIRNRLANGWVRIEDIHRTGYLTDPGFSGSPVWGEILEGVMGMAIISSIGERSRDAFLLPTDLLAEILPEQIQTTSLPSTEDWPTPWISRELIIGGSVRSGRDAISRSQRAKVSRYSDISFPARTHVGRVDALRVVITVEPASELATRINLELPSNEAEPMKVDACVVVSDRDFDSYSPSVQTINVPWDADSEPVIFKLKPKSVGKKRIAVEFFQEARYLGRAEVKTTVGEGEEPGVSWSSSVQSTLALSPQHPHQLAPDLTIYIQEITMERGHPMYRFLLLSPLHKLDLNFEEAGEMELQAPPEIYFEQLFAELDNWLGEHDVDDTTFFKRLGSLGANLYDQLFPEKLKRIYWEKLRKEVETVQIISSEPWIPWELVRPYHPETLEEEDFLCEQFALTRWLAGSSSPDTIHLQNLALVTAAYDLSAVEDEAEALRKLPGVKVRDVSPSLLGIYKLLETGGFGGLHFACHGEYDPHNPDQSAVLLETGSRFRPNDITGKKRTFGRDEPLVFLNACETGRAGLSLTGLGGWAKAFIGAGAGGFIGSTWQAHDESAYKFAIAFYSHLLDGKSVAEAARQARQEIRKAGDPTWLSYTVYANPLARLSTSTGAASETE